MRALEVRINGYLLYIFFSHRIKKAIDFFVFSPSQLEERIHVIEDPSKLEIELSMFVKTSSKIGNKAIEPEDKYLSNHSLLFTRSKNIVRRYVVC